MVTARGIYRFNRSYLGDRFRRNPVVAAPPREGLFTEPTTDAHPWRRERVLMPLSRPSETSGKPADEGRNPEARSLAVSHRHRVPGYLYVQPNINFAMLVHGSSPALRKGPPHASNLADLAVWDEPPSSARTCGHTVKLRSLWYLGVFWAPAQFSLRSASAAASRRRASSHRSAASRVRCSHPPASRLRDC